MSPPKSKNSPMTINSAIMRQFNKEIRMMKNEIKTLIKSLTPKRPKTRASIKKKSNKK